MVPKPQTGGQVESIGMAQAESGGSTEDGRAWGQLGHELSTALTVMKGRIQLLRRRVQRGDEVARLETDLAAIEAELARLTTTVERIHQKRAQ
jgi:signal transduction histidine kinase